MESHDGASLVGIADTFADGNLEGKKEKVWIVQELEVHLCAFVYVVLLFTKPSRPLCLCDQSCLPVQCLSFLPWCPHCQGHDIPGLTRPINLPHHMYMKSGNNM